MHYCRVHITPRTTIAAAATTRTGDAIENNQVGHDHDGHLYHQPPVQTTTANIVPNHGQWVVELEGGEKSRELPDGASLSSPARGPSVHGSQPVEEHGVGHDAGFMSHQNLGEAYHLVQGPDVYEPYL